jgi:hypothetical protein
LIRALSDKRGISNAESGIWVSGLLDESQYFSLQEKYIIAQGITLGKI